METGGPCIVNETRASLTMYHRQQRSNSDIICDNCFKICKTPEDDENGKEQQCNNCLHSFCSRAAYSGGDEEIFVSELFNVQSEEGCGRFLIAKRDIQPGEVILVEKPLIVGPMMMDGGTHLYPTCLGCCRVTNTSYCCSKCKWPVCNETCEKMSSHADFECKVFRKAKIPCMPYPHRYQIIQFLRCCLLRDISAKKFCELMSLESHVDDRKRINEYYQGKNKESKVGEQAYRFITEMCKLRYDFELINYIIGVCWVNSFGADALLGYKKRRCSLLFHKLSMLNHTCIPNTCLVIHEKRDEGKSLLPRGIGNIWGELRAAVLIREGEMISQQYVNVVQGTMERRCALLDNWYFSCICARCSDPTERETFFSAVKCKNCPSGYLLPANPLDSTVPWRCQYEGDEEERDIHHCDNLVWAQDIRDSVKQFTTTILACKDDIRKLEELLKENSGNVFHSNHYLIQDVKYQIVEEFINIGAPKLRSDDSTKRPCLLGNGMDFHELAARAAQYSRDLLKIGNIISPGESTYRGVIIYFLCFSIYSLLRGKSNEDEDERLELEYLVEQGKIILSKEPQDSPYKSMAERLGKFLL